MLTAEATLLQARQSLAGVTATAAQQRITLLLTVGGTYEPNNSYSRLAKDYSHD
jgi:outer membrane protein TolC